MRTLIVISSLTWSLVLGATAVRSADDASIQIPKDYRQWTHVKSMLIHGTEHPLHGSFGGLHHVYANPQAAAFLRNPARSGPFPDGSTLVFDLLEARDERGAWVEGSRRELAVMVKDAARYPSTGGWGFQAFAAGDPTRPVVKDAAEQCFGCHQPQSQSDYVFSTWRP